MRLRLALAVLLGTMPAAFAEGFEIVVPNRPDVPIVINGIDVNYAVLEGDFGLGKGVNNQPTIYGGRLPPPEPNVGHYYPTLGLRPASGRLEIEPPPNRKLPQPAESYHQSWQSQSMPIRRPLPTRRRKSLFILRPSSRRRATATTSGETISQVRHRTGAASPRDFQIRTRPNRRVSDA